LLPWIPDRPLSFNPQESKIHKQQLRYLIAHITGKLPQLELAALQ
jgi:hypothetical protein